MKHVGWNRADDDNDDEHDNDDDDNDHDYDYDGDHECTSRPANASKRVGGNGLSQ
jgi:hypothetical protein